MSAPQTPPRSSRFSRPLMTVLVLMLALAGLAGGLLFAASRVTLAPVAETDEPEKIGPVLTRRALAPRPAAAPATTEAPAAVTLDPAPPAAGQPLLVPLESPPVSEPEETAAAAEPAPPAPVAAAQKGQAGCTRYKSYNPQTRTYRAFDGTIRECRSAD